MAAFGWNPYPKEFGGGPSVLEQEHAALLDRLAPGWDASPGTESWCELYAHALAVTMIWQVNRRLAVQFVPQQMLDTLTTWEQATQLRPLATDAVQVRRAAVAAKLRGLAGNAIFDIAATALAAAGVNYVRIDAPPPDQIWMYWPGRNPGPPGSTWASNRASVSVVLTRGTLGDGDFFQMIESLTNTLNALVPAWMQFCIGEDLGGFVCSVGICGITLMGGA